MIGIDVAITNNSAVVFMVLSSIKARIILKLLSNQRTVRTGDRILKENDNHQFKQNRINPIQSTGWPVIVVLRVLHKHDHNHRHSHQERRGHLQRFQRFVSKIPRVHQI